MINAFGATLSGLNAAAQRLNASAANIAGQSATAAVKDGKVVNEPYRPVDVVQISVAAGGVKTELRERSQPTEQRFDPTDAAADENGLVQAPNVDTAPELVNALVAKSDFQANIAAFKAQDATLQSLLDIPVDIKA